ncbi:MAG: glycerol-3-phosphate 1-O-acyltransferase PlsY [Pseudomonadota bacterium]
MSLLSAGISTSAVLIAYLVGSIASAIIVCRLLGLPDPRTDGSGNPGATNVLRLGGKKAAAITLVGDILKGLLPVLLARLAGLEVAVIAAVGVAALLGHLFPIFFGFRGGKGLATAFGVVAGYSWFAVAAMAGIWLGVAALSRLSSLAALVASIALPGILWMTTNDLWLTGGGGLLTLLIVYRHKANISRLLAGTEPRIGKKAVEHAPAEAGGD